MELSNRHGAHARRSSEQRSSERRPTKKPNFDCGKIAGALAVGALMGAYHHGHNSSTTVTLSKKQLWPYSCIPSVCCSFVFPKAVVIRASHSTPCTVSIISCMMDGCCSFSCASFTIFVLVVVYKLFDWIIRKPLIGRYSER